MNWKLIKHHESEFIYSAISAALKRISMPFKALGEQMYSECFGCEVSKQAFVRAMTNASAVRRSSFEILVSSAAIVCFASDTHTKVKNDPPKHVACDYLWTRALLWNCINRLRWNTNRSHFINSCLRVNIKFRRLFLSLFDRFLLLPQHFSCRFFIIAECTCRKCLVIAACLSFPAPHIPLSMRSPRSVHFWFSLTLTVNPKIKIHEFFVLLLDKQSDVWASIKY